MPYLAKGDVNVHRILSRSDGVEDVESVILSAGDSISEEELPGYLKAAIDAGDVPLLEKVSSTEAKKVAKDRAAAESKAATEEVVNASNAADKE